MNYDILKSFKSKRNKVYLINYELETERRLAILKKYELNKQSFLESEYRNINFLKTLGVNVPEVLYKGDDFMITEYIQGELVVELVERSDMGEWIDKLALWISKLHSFSRENKSLLKMDVNLRNFIYSDGNIYGLDFEEVGYGDYRTDLANICFFILTDRPSFIREKDIIIRRFLSSYENQSKKVLHGMDKFLLRARTEAKMRRANK